MPFLQEPAEDAPVVRVRDLHDDENFVLSEFERHAGHCSRCADPLDAFREGRSLCERGHQYAIDVAEYVFSKNGKAYSVVDQGFNQQTLVKIPRDCKAARRLLLAIEEGLRLRRSQQQDQGPVISYDSTYPVAPRRPAAPEPYTQIIERAPRTRRRVIVYRRGSPSRGSLYESDFVDRIERHYDALRVHRPAEYFR
ncbi:hypothetical protein VTN96DRAFT_1759 [Rasamsonia emersonii]|uniref:Uncharacterized protein n=1 Tax=Rasamsonia emersonii (strain ATCC 16479 / CBS 393.64 / IMI 116815) TaxID=1408163 RepID=A0A0F4Z5S5_RASE3|nr:hypothetical protein T310_0744 [Rasamsonia emersonii CBS 393.64]KKA25218.1 hypothetical protein T310_0744 [Rasamsonia emersonii CBS 393.64]